MEKEIQELMKSTLTGLAAAFIVTGTTLPIVQAASTTSNQWFKMTIQVNSTTLSHTSGITESDGSTSTTYLPMYYVNLALEKAGFLVTWDGTKKVWALTTAKTGLKFSTTGVGTGNTSLTVNGVVVKKMNTVVQADPAGGAKTTYVPIYYLTDVFETMGLLDVWNGTTHVWAISDATPGNSSGSTTGSTGSTSSSGSTSNIAAPIIRMLNNSGSSSIAVSGAVDGSTLALYNSVGNQIVSTTAGADGTATFYNIGVGSYYAIDTVNGSASKKSNVVTVAISTTTSSPSIFTGESNGAWYIGVNNAASGSSVTLYSTAGTKISSATVNQYGYATFYDLGNGTYYVEATVNGQAYQSNAVSVNTAATTPVVATPVATKSVLNGVTTITVANAVQGATVTLYTSAGSVSSTTTANAAGTASFTNVTPGSYYVEQSSGGEQSTASNTVVVSAALTTPTLTTTSSNGSNSLTVSNVIYGSTVTLYSASGNVVATTTANSTGYATFSNVAVGTYYALQNWSGETSAASNEVTVATTLSTPTLTVTSSNGTNTLTVSNVIYGSTVTLYSSTGTVVTTTTGNSTGYATFTNVANGTYFARQYWNGQTSAASNDATVTLALTVPSAYVSSSNGVYSVTVTNVTAGSTVMLYNSSGSLYSTAIANSSDYATFTSVPVGDYYVSQTWSGQTSAASSYFVV